MTTPPRLPHAALRRGMADRRSGEVVFLSHCLLNQNTRYPGGAVCPGVVLSAITPYVENGTGIVQLPCPEQRTWGGVAKTRLLWLLEHPRIARAATPVVGLLRGYLRVRYRRLARRVAGEVADYRANGLRVLGVVGVAGSPTCGVHTTMDLGTAAARLVPCPLGRTRDAQWMNTAVVAPSLIPGQGLFIEELARELGRRGLHVPVLEESLENPPRRTTP